MNKHCCVEMKTHLDNGEIAINYIAKFREYGIKYLDGGTSFQQISYCPWCGTKLLESLRDQWLDEIRRKGFEPEQENIPEKYKTDKWWSKAS